MNFWWEADAPLWTVLLAPAEAVYALGAALHRRSVRPLKARVPVISVGNLVVGGAGKTPVTLALALRLAARGRRPLVLSRGYGRASSEPRFVNADSRAAEVGDEPLMLARHGVRVQVGPRRAELALAASDADVVLLDDGLQHHALERDLDVIVADASNPFGNGHLLPRGPLRERVASLRRVKRGLLWLTRCDLPRDPRVADLLQLGFHGPVESSFAPSGSVELRGKRVFLFAGVARPESFRALAQSLGADVAGVRWFRDHHAFSAAELSQLRRSADAAGADLLLTTEKDFVRIDPAFAARIACLPVELRITAGEAALDQVLP